MEFSSSSQNEIVIVGPLGPMVDSRFSNLATLAVDGGAKWTQRIDLWVGDADSLEGPLPECKRILLDKNKSRSDLGFAWSEITENTKTIHLWGFLGGRRDHEWFNLGEVHQGLSTRPGTRAIFYDSTGRERVWMASSGVWSFVHQGLFSLASLVSNEVTLTGDCEYRLDQQTRIEPLSSLGLSNSSRGRFNIEASHPFLIFLE
jgi:thiamine pyrophosphokinase